MLTRLTVKNFRLLRDVVIDFEEDAPTVFIGPNGSGKSTVLEVLDFLARCAGQGLQEATRAHGGLGNLKTVGAAGPIEIKTELKFKTGERRRQFDLEWSIMLDQTTNGTPLVVAETLVDRGGKAPKSLVTGDVEEWEDRQVHSEVDATEVSPVTNPRQLAFEAFVDANRYPGLAWLNRTLSGINVLGAISTAPEWARADLAQQSPRDTMVIGPKDFLDRQGLGLANALYGLFTEHADAWEQLERAFRAEFPFVRRITFPADAGGSKISFAIEDSRFPARKLYASELSDGMISLLCLLTAVLQPNQSAVLALDEPDANLHPSALRRFMSLAHKEHRHRRLAIVTHSTALLDELQDPAKSIRIVEPGKDGAVVRRVDKDALTAWLKTYSLSELRQTGLLDAPNTGAANAE